MLATALFKEAFWLQPPQLVSRLGDEDTDPHPGQRKQLPGPIQIPNLLR